MIFLIVDRVHAGLLCLHWYCICLVLPDLFLCRTNHFGEFFLNSAESSKRINQSSCTVHMPTCILITYLSFSERTYTKKIMSSIKKFESWDNAEGTALVSATQAKVLQSKLRVSCLRNGLELKFKTHDNRKCKKNFCLHTFFCYFYGLPSNTEFRLCMFHVKMRRLACSSAHVTIFLSDNANVCWNSSAWTKKYKKKQYFSTVHISLSHCKCF